MGRVTQRQNKGYLGLSKMTLVHQKCFKKIFNSDVKLKEITKLCSGDLKVKYNFITNSDNSLIPISVPQLFLTFLLHKQHVSQNSGSTDFLT